MITKLTPALLRVTPFADVAFTGTQKGISINRREILIRQIRFLNPKIVWHGDCVGADTQFHEILRKLFPRVRIYIAPGDVSPEKRGFNDGDLTAEVMPPLERNKLMVLKSEQLIACPDTTQEMLRSGTWATIRFARKHNKTIWRL